MSNKIRVMVTGPCNSGKTTVAALIDNMLRQVGFSQIEIKDESHVNFHPKELDLALFFKRVQALLDRETQISIETINTRRSMSQILEEKSQELGGG